MATPLNIIRLFAFLLICTGCSTMAGLPSEADKTSTGLLDESAYRSLRQILSAHAPAGLKDTILIKYDYNNESCWNFLDTKDDNHIRGFITRGNERILNVSKSRPHVSVFQFREPGKNLNKIKRWNTAIIVDSSRQLFQLLFKKRSICGNSIAVLPDRRFVFLRSDSHSEVLDLTHDKIVAYFTVK